MLKKLIKQELANPQQYQPICKGWLVALLIAGLCAISVPFHLIEKLYKR